MSYHPSALRGEPPAVFPSTTPERFASSRMAGEIETKVAEQAIHHAADTPSSILLPIAG